MNAVVCQGLIDPLYGQSLQLVRVLLRIKPDKKLKIKELTLGKNFSLRHYNDVIDYDEKN